MLNLGNLSKLLIAAALTCSAGVANAVTATCSGGNKYVQLSSVAANDSNNVVCQSGNPDYSGPIFEETFFGETFTLAFKSTGFNLVKEKGDEAVTFKTFSTSTVPGTWELNPVAANIEKIIIGIKQGTTYAGFLVNSTSGEWATGNNANSLKSEYSHVDIWYTIAPVPLPATGLLLAGALGGIGLMRRRKTS